MKVALLPLQLRDAAGGVPAPQLRRGDPPPAGSRLELRQLEDTPAGAGHGHGTKPGNAPAGNRRRCASSK